MRCFIKCIRGQCPYEMIRQHELEVELMKKKIADIRGKREIIEQQLSTKKTNSLLLQRQNYLYAFFDKSSQKGTDHRVNGVPLVKGVAKGQCPYQKNCEYINAVLELRLRALGRLKYNEACEYNVLCSMFNDCLSYYLLQHAKEDDRYISFEKGELLRLMYCYRYDKEKRDKQRNFEICIWQSIMQKSNFQKHFFEVYSQSLQGAFERTCYATHKEGTMLWIVSKQRTTAEEIFFVMRHIESSGYFFEKQHGQRIGKFEAIGFRMETEIIDVTEALRYIGKNHRLKVIGRLQADGMYLENQILLMKDEGL